MSTDYVLVPPTRETMKAEEEKMEKWFETMGWNRRPAFDGTYPMPDNMTAGHKDKGSGT